MTAKISHHPSDATLEARASGTLDQARGLIVDMHVARCPACAERMKLFEAVGGALLEDTAVAPLKPGALERAFRQLAQEKPEFEPGPRSTRLKPMNSADGAGSVRAYISARFPCQRPTDLRFSC
jgi:putative transcriptional regulator